MVQRFTAAGGEVVAVDVSDAVHALAAPRVLAIQADVRVQADVDRAVAAAARPLDVLCNNAGVVDRLSFIDEATDEEWSSAMEVNARGTFMFSRAAVPGMLANGGGAIINVASTAGIRGGRAGVAYTASKFAIVGITLNIAATLGSEGIRCNAICPGGMATKTVDDIAMFNFTERGLAFMEARRSFMRIAQPEQVARVAVLLAGDDADWINGAIIPVDAGWAAY
jgi:NAD(P)-dependent dehydrogenase (short-subunit alcohol dehydrogenase family)